MFSPLIRARWPIFGLCLAGLVLLALFGEEVQFDQSVESFFADDDPAVVNYQRASELFDDDQFVFVAYDDPELLTPAGIERVGELADSIRGAGIDGVTSVQSLDAMPVFWQLDDILVALERLPSFLRDASVDLAKRGLSGDGGGGRFVTPTIAGAIRDAGGDAREMAALRERIASHPLLEGTLVAPSGTSTALMVRLKPAGEHDAKVTIAALRSIADRFADTHGFDRRPAVVGPPVLLADGFRAIEIDGQRLASAGMLLIALVMLSATRSLWWAAVPVIAGWTTWLATEAVLAALDIRLSLSSGPLVAQIIVLTMPAASHLALHFRDDRRRMADRRRAADETLRSVSEPILWCALTATIGYGALVSSNVVPVRQFGAVLAIATAAASLIVIALAPTAMMPPIPLEIPVRKGSESHASTAVNRLTDWVYHRPAPIVAAMVGTALLMSIGMFFLRYESNYINAFKPTTRVVRYYRFVESRLGGIGLVGLVVPAGPEVDDAMLARLAALDDRVRSIRRSDGSPGASYATSLATVLDPDGRFADLEGDRRAWISDTKLELIRSSPQAGLLDAFWDPGSGMARVLVRLSESQPAPEKAAIFERAEAMARDAFGAEEPERVAYLTGLSHLLTQTTRGVVETQWTTFSWAAVGILLMLTLAFRGPKLAMLALLPTMLAVGMVLGLMGWLGLKLDIATALVASVALGLSVDDTYHCLLQFRRLRQSSGFEEALFAGYAVSGPGVLLSSFAVAIGFSVLLFSEFVPFATFGLMVAIATAGSSLGNLVLLPACLSLAYRWQSRRGAMAGAGSGDADARVG